MTLRTTLLISLLFCFGLNLSSQDCPGYEVPNFYIDDQFVLNGSNICVDILIEDFVNVQSFQFIISFDPTVLDYVGPFMDLGVLSQAINFNDQAPQTGLIYIVYEAFGLEDTAPDGSAMISLCFDVIGDPGTSSPFNLIGANNTSTIEIVYGDGCIHEYDPYLMGTIWVTCDQLTADVGICHSDNGNATINFSFCGGTPNYTWTLTGAGGPYNGTSTDGQEQSVSGLASGNYTLSTMDASGAMISESITVENIPGLGVNIDLLTPPLCATFANGMITAQGVGGVSALGVNYDYAWSNGQFTPDIVQLGNGTYTVTVTDEVGCTATEEVVFDVSPVQFDVLEVKPDTCGGNVGSIEFEISGGTPILPNDVYSVTIFQAPFVGNVNSAIIEGLGVGPYEIQVTDGAGCPLDVDVKITDIQPMITTTTTTEDISCFGECDGSFILDINQPGNFIFSNVQNQTTGQIVPANDITSISGQGYLEVVNLCEGVWTVSAVEASTTCPFDTTIRIEEPVELNLSIDMVNNSTNCLNHNGSIFVSANGGSGSYQWLWDPPVTNTNTIWQQAEPGTYNITVVDANMCRDSVEVIVGLDNEAEVDINVIDGIGCNGSTQGQLEAVPASGTISDYTFEWFNTTTNFIISNSQLAFVDIGTYHIVMTNNQSGCTDSDTITLNATNDLTFEMTFTDPMCFDSLGTVEFFNITGGQGPYNLIWSDVLGTTDIITDIVPDGTYDITLTDGFGCTRDTFVTLTQPNRIIATVDQIEFTTCPGGNDGSFSVSAQGGTTTNGYTFDWSTSLVTDEFNVTQSTADNLPEGDYLLTIIDEVGCPFEVPFSIESPDSIEIDQDASIIISPDCPQLCNGAMNLVFTGGTPSSSGNDYSILWDDSSTDFDRTDLCPNMYMVTVTDDAGCTAEFNFDFTVSGNPIEIMVDSLLSQSLPCNSDPENPEGRITVFATGGSGVEDQYSYEWTDDVSFNTSAVNLSAGLYTITVTDINGCSATTSYEVMPPSANSLSVTIPEPDMVNCAGETSCISVTSASGGAGSPYFVQIGAGGTTFPLDSCIDLFAGIYEVSVFDIEGCPFDTIIEIFEPTITSVDLGGNLEFELGQTDAELNIDYQGDVPIVDVMWTMTDTFDCVPICESITFEVTQDQLVSVVVTDESGCTAVDDIQISVNNQRKVFLPNMLVPGDDENGIVMVYPGLGATMINSFSIYDRWGNQVYNLVDIPVDDASFYGWDGNIQGSPAETGVYVYIADILYIDGESRVFTSDLTLIR